MTKADRLALCELSSEDFEKWLAVGRKLCFPAGGSIVIEATWNGCLRVEILYQNGRIDLRETTNDGSFRRDTYHLDAFLQSLSVFAPEGYIEHSRCIVAPDDFRAVRGII